MKLYVSQVGELEHKNIEESYKSEDVYKIGIENEGSISNELEEGEEYEYN